MKREYLILPILLALFISICIAYVKGNIGVDIIFHMNIAKEYSTCNFMGAFNIFYNIDHTFYPPLFHFMLVPGFWLGIPNQWVTLIQITILPLTISSFMFLIYKRLGTTQAFFGGLLLFGSLAYLDRVYQAQPQGLDFFLLPLVIYFATELGKSSNRKYILLSTLMIWNHGFVSISAISGTLLRKLREKQYKTILSITLGASAILILSLYFLLTGLKFYGGNIDTNQEFAFWHNPLFIPLYLMLPTIGFPIAIYKVYQWYKTRTIKPLVSISILTILTLAIMIPVWADRWIQYCTIPLSILILEQTSISKRNTRLIVYTLISIFSFFMITRLLF
jgi:hypothetical protein